MKLPWRSASGRFADFSVPFRRQVRQLCCEGVFMVMLCQRSGCRLGEPC